MEILLNDHVAARFESGVLTSYEGSINRVLTLGILRAINKADEVAAVKITEPLHFVDRADCGSEPSHDLRLQLETQVHSLRPNVKQHVTGRRDSMTLPSTYLAKLMQFSWSRLPEQLVPGIGPKPHDAGESSLLFAKSYRAHESG